MAHMMKHTKASCGHMFAHFDRRAENISNENLDRTRTPLNYNLATHQQMEQGEFVRQRCSEVRCQNRKDVNVMVSWVVTVPKNLPESEHKAFFQASYHFLEKRYGKENVVSAYVHMDEVTPHMHFAFVPVIYDAKKERHKVSAKEVVNRYDLQSFHIDLQKYVEGELGHEVGILNEATREGNQSIEELKRQSATERLQEATAEASKIVSKAQKQVRLIKDSLIPLQAEYRAKKAYVDAIGKDFDRVDGVEEQTNFFGQPTGNIIVSKTKWETQAVTRADREAQKRADKAFIEKVEEFKTTFTSKRMAALSQRCRELEEKNQQLKQEASRAEDEADRLIDRVNRVLNQLPAEVAEAFIKLWNQEKEQQHKGKLNPDWQARKKDAPFR